MEIHVDSLLEGARRAKGVVVIVDVFRAFTTAAVALARGADRIVMVADPGEALALRPRFDGALCIGEIDGIRPPGFDFGNSPHELAGADLGGRTLIQSTRAGTTGIEAVGTDGPVYAASLAVAGATAEVVCAGSPGRVTIVAMGWAGRVRTDEDELCALYLRNRMEGRRPDPDAVAALVRAGGEAAKFDDPAQPHFHPEDLSWALRVDAFDFGIRVVREAGLPVARRA